MLNVQGPQDLCFFSRDFASVFYIQSCLCFLRAKVRRCDVAAKLSATSVTLAIMCTRPRLFGGYYRLTGDLKEPLMKILRFFASLRIEKLLTCMGAHRQGNHSRENSSRMANSFRFYASGRPASSSSDILFR